MRWIGEYKPFVTSYSFSGVPGAHFILSLMTGTRSLTLLVIGMRILPIPKRDCFVVSKCLRKIMTVSALLAWLSFVRGRDYHEISGKRGEKLTLEGSGRISRYNRRSLGCRMLLLRISSTARGHRKK